MIDVWNGKKLKMKGEQDGRRRLFPKAKIVEKDFFWLQPKWVWIDDASNKRTSIFSLEEQQ